jgi:CRP/FNR family transcriptional regulator, cyclic AMP receptor protein
MREYVEQFRKVNLFLALNDNELEMISRIAHPKTAHKGQVIFQEGEPGDSFYTILQGRVKVCLYDEGGKEYVLDVIKSGDYFGELSLINDLPRSASLISLENSEFLTINRHDFTRLLMENPAITLSLLKTCSNRLRAADERIRGLAFYSVEVRVLMYLIDLAKHTGVKVRNNIIIESGPTQADIAGSCGCSRETVSRMIKNLVKKGILRVRRKQYTLYPAHLY